MTKIAEENNGKTLAQVAINWVLGKGAIPIVGAKNMTQTKDNIASLDWQLGEEGIAKLDEAASSIKA